MFRIGLGVGRPLPSFGAFDSDAQAFLSAAGITDATQQAAINTLVVDLKGYGIWSKMKAVYPFVGGTASTHKYNLVNPVDSDAAFRLVFNGGWTHSSTGATPNGTNGYADTKLVPSSVLTNNNYHLSHYSRTQSLTTSIELGADDGTANKLLALDQYYNALLIKAFAAGGYPSYTVTINNTDTLGFMIGSRTSSTSAKIFMDGTYIAQNTTTNLGTLPNINLYLCAVNTSGGVAYDFSNKQTAFASIGDGLSSAEASNLYTAVQAFQTSLSRQV